MTGTYTWSKQTTSFTNTTKHWCVLIGLDASANIADTNTVTVRDSPTTIIDSFTIQKFGTAASEIMIYLPRRMLIPPGGQVGATSTATVSIITCNSDSIEESLRMALAIL